MFAEAGFPYRPHPEVVPNSRLALELGEQARVEGRHGSYHEATMAAYWSDGRDIGDPDVLRDLAEGAGVSRDGIRDALERRAHRESVDASTAAAARAGISAVPAFVIDERVLVLGAQPSEVLERAVEQARAAAAG